jgi:hemerythrin-like domain-containing protein
MTTVPVFDRLREDHRRVLAEIGVLEAALGASGRVGELDGLLREAVELLERQFKTHMNAEDDLLYPMLADALPETEASLKPLRGEHDELRSMLAGLLWVLSEPPTPERDEQVPVQVRDLVDLLRIHIRKEEALVFRVAEQLLSPHELEALAARVGDRIHPPPEDAPRPGT